MNKRMTIGLIGCIDPEETLFDGQTIKTRTIYKLLVDRYGASAVKCVDTRQYKLRPFSVIADLISCLFTCDDMIVLLSSNGRRVFCPVLSVAARTMKKRIYHNLIGGRLADELQQNPRYMRYLSSFAVNWVESRKLEERLTRLGLANARYLPNFKTLHPADLNEVKQMEFSEHPPYRMCTFSRVTEKKGINEALLAITQLNEKVGFSPRHDGSSGASDSAFATLDIYGPIDDAYKDEFEVALKSCPYAKYKGIVAPESSVEVIKDYYALLFPTKWAAEGMPGTIIDALSAGVPIVASKWPYYSEMLEDGVTGFGYDFDKPELLLEALEKLLLGEVEIETIRTNCLNHSRSYAPNLVFGEIVRVIEENMDINFSKSI